MILGPLTGWVIVSTAKVRLQTMLFGTVPWPDLPVSAALHDPAEGLHGLLAFVGLLLILLHVAGALYHHFKREDVIGRMMPAAIASHKAVGIAAAVAIVGGFLAMTVGRTMSFTPAAQTAPVVEPSASDMSDIEEPAAVASDAAVAAEPSAAASELAASAKARPWKLEKGGRLGFTAEYSGEAIRGTFNRWDAAIVFDPDDLPGSSIRVTIDLASVESGDGQRDDMLKGDSFFGAGAQPQARFVSSAIRKRGEGRYVANGTLALHGKSRPVAVNFTLKIDGDKATASGSTTLQRLAFGVGESEFSTTDQMKDAVGVDFTLKATRQGD
jgi:polyisoprenoid-binding protein YceI